MIRLLLAALLLVAGCGAGSAVSHYGQVTAGAKGATTKVEVGKGQRFALAVPDNPGVGDSWELVELPDVKVAAYISHEREAAGERPGAGGTSYFVFNAKRPGTARIRLFDCWRCTDRKNPTPESGEAIFDVTVR
ncbi:protease inhibitor I42 family protein [Nonomuraea sp. NPDC050310]|uniref:protease inhibitor I42 family protein n=1 Tax=unclassified Nonomuraea TaxID=2593643 RepID=UPI0033C856DB